MSCFMKLNKQRKGFTLVEAVVTALIASLIMLVIQSLFSHSVRSALKGEDSLDSIRAASRLFAVLQSDFMQLTKIDTYGATSTVPQNTYEIPSTAIYGEGFTVHTRLSIIKYSLVTSANGKFIEREEKIGANIKKRRFGIPRIKEFEVLLVTIKNKVGGIVKENSQILVNLVVQSQNKNFPASEIKLSSLFFPDRLTTSDWNYIIF